LEWDYFPILGVDEGNCLPAAHPSEDPSLIGKKDQAPAKDGSCQSNRFRESTSRRAERSANGYCLDKVAGLEAHPGYLLTGFSQAVHAIFINLSYS
jgi:hypothetical protein